MIIEMTKLQLYVIDYHKQNVAWSKRHKREYMYDFIP